MCAIFLFRSEIWCTSRNKWCCTQHKLLHSILCWAKYLFYFICVREWHSVCSSFKVKAAMKIAVTVMSWRVAFLFNVVATVYFSDCLFGRLLICFSYFISWLFVFFGTWNFLYVFVYVSASVFVDPLSCFIQMWSINTWKRHLCFNLVL